MARFLLIITGLALASLAIAHFCFYEDWVPALPSFLYETTILLAFTTGLIYAYLSRSRRPAFYVQFYLLSMVVKLIAFLAYNLFMILDDRPGAWLNVLYFLVLYLIFTAVEITFLYRKNSGRS